MSTQTKTDVGISTAVKTKILVSILVLVGLGSIAYGAGIMPGLNRCNIKCNSQYSSRACSQMKISRNQCVKAKLSCKQSCNIQKNTRFINNKQVKNEVLNLNATLSKLILQADQIGLKTSYITMEQKKIIRKANLGPQKTISSLKALIDDLEKAIQANNKLVQLIAENKSTNINLKFFEEKRKNTLNNGGNNIKTTIVDLDILIRQLLKQIEISIEAVPDTELNYSDPNDDKEEHDCWEHADQLRDACVANGGAYYSCVINPKQTHICEECPMPPTDCQQKCQQIRSDCFINANNDQAQLAQCESAYQICSAENCPNCSPTIDIPPPTNGGGSGTVTGGSYYYKTD